MGSPGRILLVLSISAVAALAAFVATKPARSGPPRQPIPEAEYWRLVDESLAVLSGEPSEADVNQLASQWQALEAVELSAGGLVSVDGQLISDLLRTDPPDLGRAERLVGLLKQAHAEWPAPRHAARDVQSLNRILSTSEFQWTEESQTPLQAWLNSQLERFLRWWYDLLARLLGPALGSGIGSIAVPVISLVILLGALAVALRSLWFSFAPQAALDSDADEDLDLITSTEALRLAEERSQQGDYRSAVRYLYISCLTSLEDRKLLRYDRSLTNREYLRAVKDRPELAATLADLIEVFERVWYGFQRIDQVTFSSYLSRVQSIRERGTDQDA